MNVTCSSPSQLYTTLTSIVLTAGQQTTGVRSTVPQLQCTSGPCSASPATALCQVQGYDSSAQHWPVWKCTMTLPQGVTLGAFSVSCEGYEGPGDVCITRGSCGLSYALVTPSASGPTVSFIVVLVVVVGVLALIGLFFCWSGSGRGQNRPSFASSTTTNSVGVTRYKTHEHHHSAPAHFGGGGGGASSGFGGTAMR